MSMEIGVKEVKMLVDLERSMDAGEQAYVFNRGGRWAMQPQILGAVGLMSGQEVPDFLLHQLLVLHLRYCEEKLAEEKLTSMEREIWMDMSRLLDKWTPSPEQEYMVLDAPGDKPISLALRVTPGPTNPDKQILLLQMVDADRWGKGAPRDWLLWEVKVSINGLAVVELDGRGPKRREIEPLKSRKRWSSASWERADHADRAAFDVAISYNPVAGGLSMVRGDDVLSGNTFLKATGDVKLIVGRPPQYSDLASPEGWTFDLSWSVGQGAPVPQPPVTPSMPDSDRLRLVLGMVASIEADCAAIRRHLDILGVRS